MLKFFLILLDCMQKKQSLYSYVDQKCFSEKEILPELIELSIDKTCFK